MNTAPYRGSTGPIRKINIDDPEGALPALTALLEENNDHESRQIDEIAKGIMREFGDGRVSLNIR